MAPAKPFTRRDDVMQTDTEWRAAERFLPAADLTDHIFLWAMTKAARGDATDLDRHRAGDTLTDDVMIECLSRFNAQTITDLAKLCELIEFTESDAYKLAVVRLNGWVH